MAFIMVKFEMSFPAILASKSLSVAKTYASPFILQINPESLLQCVDDCAFRIQKVAVNSFLRTLCKIVREVLARTAKHHTLRISLIFTVFGSPKT
jgi:hypothetical protein